MPNVPMTIEEWDALPALTPEEEAAASYANSIRARSDTEPTNPLLITMAEIEEGKNQSLRPIYWVSEDDADQNACITFEDGTTYVFDGDFLIGDGYGCGIPHNMYMLMRFHGETPKVIHHSWDDLLAKYPHLHDSYCAFGAVKHPSENSYDRFNRNSFPYREPLPFTEQEWNDLCDWTEREATIGDYL